MTIPFLNDLSVDGDLTITGNLTVSGTTTTVDTTNMNVEDPLVLLGANNAADAVDEGFIGKYNDGTDKYWGLFRDASDSGKVKLFCGLTDAPTTTVNTGHASYAVCDLEVGAFTATSINGVDFSTFNAAQFLTLAASAAMANERVFTAGTGISAADGGAGGAYTVSLDITGLTAVAPAAADEIPFYDTSGTAIGKMTITQLMGVIDHGTIAGLTDDDHTQYALLAGRAGGQVLIGGTAAGEDLTLRSSSNATKGSLIIDQTIDTVLHPYGTGAGETQTIKFLELAANGTNFVGFKAPDALAADVTWVLPNADATASGQVLSSDASGNLSWATVATGGSHKETIGDGVATTITVTHNLNSLDVLVQVVRVADGVTVTPTVTRTGVNAVDLTFNTAPTASQYRVLVYEV